MNLDRILQEIQTKGLLLKETSSFYAGQPFIRQEITGAYGSKVLKDMKDTLAMYAVYTSGAMFEFDRNTSDWTPSEWRAKQIKKLIDKEARFLFSQPPTFTLKSSEDIGETEQFLKTVLKSNNFNSKLVRGAKDCLIGKRLAIVVNFNDTVGIDISFVPSLGFIYETSSEDSDLLTKFIQFHGFQDENTNLNRLYKKKWELVDGVCRVTETIHETSGRLLETKLDNINTGLPFIPVAIVLNDGLSGDTLGISEAAGLIDSESTYSKLASKDVDSLRKGTDQITYTIDADPMSTKNLSRAAGSFWDLATDPTKDDKTAQVGTLDNPMSYAAALDTSLSRLKTDMHDQVGVPDTSSSALQGIITSGKTMQAIYWDLQVRCDEKMLDWSGAFEKMIRYILVGANLFPSIRAKYTQNTVVSDCSIEITNSYPILQDETEDKANDVMEIQAKTRSRKSYLKKWYNLTDEEIEEELVQIQKEKEMLEQETYPAEV